MGAQQQASPAGWLLLKTRGIKGLATLCIGGGEGTAVALELI
jgi:acetyl-CoA acetyltransferase